MHPILPALLFVASMVLKASAQAIAPLCNATLFDPADVYFNGVRVPCNGSVSASETTSPPVIGLTSSQLANESAKYISIVGDLSNLGPDGNFSTALYWLQTDLVPSTDNLIVPTTAPVVPWLSPALELPCNKTDTFVVLLYPQPSNFTVPADFVNYFANIRANPLDFSARLNSTITTFLTEANLSQEGGALVQITGLCGSNSSSNGTAPSKPTLAPVPFTGGSSAFVGDFVLMTWGLGVVGWVLALF